MGFAELQCDETAGHAELQCDRAQMMEIELSCRCCGLQSCNVTRRRVTQLLLTEDALAPSTSKANMSGDDRPFEFNCQHP
ncbi:hypothetical protein CBR_g3581 [Chara braunii]|uniref:Uncharacterized protein n=1 Tax=Chara braunii TaxID=69332 RepID=A0A388KFY3_CHABU|nr:hypothetical protein CBR_g3581 [Chara braunii]|eukprot:GBG68883.1 hypothetical protein CBR_g3581 [Chara braunii]